jgi:osmotically-inducible protein OsmY
MPVGQELIKQLHAALERDARINLHRYPIQLEIDDDALVLEGEVGTIAAKRLALEKAARLNGGQPIVDHLRVAPAQRKGDGDVRDATCAFLLNEPALMSCGLSVATKGAVETLREPMPDPESCGAIEVDVQDGVVALRGHVISLSHKRFAGVLAWWVPGSRDVINELQVRPYQDGNDDEITDAVRLALEKDPLVDADQVRVDTRESVVLLQGYVVNEEEKRMAEIDAWYVLGVRDVINRIGVQ